MSDLLESNEANRRIVAEEEAMLLPYRTPGEVPTPEQQLFALRHVTERFHSAVIDLDSIVTAFAEEEFEVADFAWENIEQVYEAYNKFLELRELLICFPPEWRRLEIAIREEIDVFCDLLFDSINLPDDGDDVLHHYSTVKRDLARVSPRCMGRLSRLSSRAAAYLEASLPDSRRRSIDPNAAADVIVSANDKRDAMAFALKQEGKTRPEIRKIVNKEFPAETVESDEAITRMIDRYCTRKRLPRPSSKRSKKPNGTRRNVP